MTGRVYTWPSLPPGSRLVCRECHCLAAVHELRLSDDRLVAWCSCCSTIPCGVRPLREDVEEG